MPIFEYACRDCGHDFETLVRASETPACTACGSDKLDKKLSVFAAQTGESQADAASCGTCGHPAGPGACALD